MNGIIEGEIRHYPYRKALPSGIILELPLSLCRDLEEALAKKAGVEPDNHVMYQLCQRHSGGDSVYIWISESTFAIAKGIREHPNGY